MAPLSLRRAKKALSLDVFAPVVSRILLPINDLNPALLRHLISQQRDIRVVSPNSSGQSWNPHSVRILWLLYGKHGNHEESHPGLGTGPAIGIETYPVAAHGAASLLAPRRPCGPFPALRCP